MKKIRIKAGQIVLFVAVLLVMSAGVGYAAFQYGKSTGEAQAVEARASLLQGRGGREANAANLIGGQVKTVNGSEIELSTATGALRVVVNDQTQFQETVPGLLADVQPGERMMVQGERAADGSWTARFVQLGGGFICAARPAGIAGTTGN